ncbi:MAG: TonB-dependent receptor [Deltaproteobacteria bacterium]|nr:MAG: TonB-dependent receptor [Deltaproteobacteria bacterium]
MSSFSAPSTTGQRVRLPRVPTRSAAPLRLRWGPITRWACALLATTSILALAPATLAEARPAPGPANAASAPDGSPLADQRSGGDPPVAGSAPIPRATDSEDAPAAENGRLAPSDPTAPEAGAATGTSSRPTATRSLAPRLLSPAVQRVPIAPAGQPAPTRRDDVLERAPGLVVGQHGTEGKGPSFLWRGFDAEHGSSLEVRWGIVPLNESSNPHGHGYIDPGVLIPESLRTLDVYEGSADLAQGPFALAGTLRFRPGVARDDRGLLLRAEGGFPWRGRGVSRWAPVDGAPEDLVVAEVLADSGFGASRRLTRVAGVGGLRLARGSRGDVTASAAGHASFFDLPGQVPVAALERGDIARDGTFSPGDGGRSLLGLAQVERLSRDGRRELGVWVRARHLMLRQNYTGFFAHPDTGDTLRQEHDSVAVGGRALRVVPLTDGLEFALGGELQGEWLSLDERDPAGARPPDRSARALQAQAGTWAGLAWTPVVPLALEAGARVDGVATTVTDRRPAAAAVEGAGESSSGATAALSPRVRAALTPLDAASLSASWGYGVRPPEVLGLLPDPDDPTAGGAGYTSGWSGTLQLDVRPHRAVHASVGGFLHLVDHELLFDHVSRRSIETSDTRRLGAQVHLHAAFLGHGEVTADAHLVSARTQGDGERLPGVPRQVARIGLGWAPPEGLRAGARGRFTGERAWGFGTAVGPVALLDVRAGWQARTIAIELQMDNVLDSAWASDGGAFPSRHDPEAPIDPVPRLHISAGAPRTTLLVLTWTPEAQP